jgi:hypothetical protein
VLRKLTLAFQPDKHFCTFHDVAEAQNTGLCHLVFDPLKGYMG